MVVIQHAAGIVHRQLLDVAPQGVLLKGVNQ